MNWWQRLRNRGRLETELDAELRYHFERLVQDHLRAGTSEEEARRRARLEFGGVDQVKEDCRDARGTRWIEDGVSLPAPSRMPRCRIRGSPWTAACWVYSWRSVSRPFWSSDVIGWIALGLSAVGLYAVTAHAVTQRTQEIGVRMALGARPSQIRWLVLRRAALQLGVGLAVGLVCAVAYDRLFIDASAADRLTDAVILIPVSAPLAAVAAAACLLPARRATRLDPVVALRYE